jgi:hypothetical protein
MDAPSLSTPQLAVTLERHLAHLKILSRLMGHELHAQNGSRVALSRDEVAEMQTSLDLFIEEMQKSKPSVPLSRVEPAPVAARLN